MTPAGSDGYPLQFERWLDAPRANLWRCWSEPALLARWFHPPRWTTEVLSLDQRPGGASHLVMRGPDGERSDGTGVFLEAIAGRRLVFTNAFRSGWIPSPPPPGTPLRTMIVELSDEGAGTRYVIRALHWSADARTRHEAGFHQGWAQTAPALEALARTL